ncbi:UNVERIFIED_CONTAM: Protein EFR3 B [Siphonaria sp. JEL0065]|nr:Protein EFR3 B [Siphonaria sp. JEL0065]
MVGCCGESGINPRSLLVSNHAALVNKVYPKDPGETGPRPSHLSTLLFYANSKPIKLVKVGDYLVKKVEADLARSKLGFVKVSLLIIDALMAQCPATHINLMAKNVLKIIDLVLASPDPDLILEASSTVEYQEIHHQIDDIKTTDGRIHLSGLRAIQSIASSDTLLMNPKAPDYVYHMIPAILSNIQEEKRLRTTSTSLGTRKTSTTNHISTISPPGLPTPTPPMRTHPSITDDLFTHPLLEQSAEESLSFLFKNGNRESLKFLVPPLWSFLEEKKLWADKTMVVHFMTIISGAVAPQYHYLLMASLLEKLKKKGGNGNTGVNVVEKTGVVLAVTVLVSAGGAGAAGISVVELLEALVALVVETAVAADNDRIGEDGEVRGFHSMLVEGVGALGIHIAYPTQLNDIVSFIVNRVGRVEGPDAEQVSIRKSLIRCLLRVVAIRRICLSPMESLQSINLSSSGKPSIVSNLAETNFELDKFSTLTRVAMGAQRTIRQKRTSLAFPTKISSVLLIPLLPYLIDSNQDIRLLTGLFFNGAIALEVVQNQLDDSVNSAAAQQSDQEFVHQTYQKLYTYSLAETSGPVDYIAIGTLISMFLKRYGSGVDGVGRSVQFLMRLQKDASSKLRKVAVYRLLVDHLNELATVFTLPKLKVYVDAKMDEKSVGIVPSTTRMETLHASIQYWVIQNGTGDSAGAAARTFSAAGDFESPALIPSTEVLPLLFQSNLINVETVKTKISEEFAVGEAGNASSSLSSVHIGKRYSVVDGGLSVVATASTKLPSRDYEGLPSSKKDVESVRSGASFRMDTPVKFEDLKDAISIHSTSTDIRIVDGSLRTVTPTPKNKIDVKKLLSNISTSISNVSQKKSNFLEPSHLGKHSIRFASSSGGDRSQDLAARVEPQPGTASVTVENEITVATKDSQEGQYLPAKVARCEN